MNDFLSIVMVTGLGAILLLSIQNRYRRFERPFLWAGFGGHFCAAIAQVLITQVYYGGGDMSLYYNTGLALAEWAMKDPLHGIITLVQLALEMDVRVPVFVLGIGGPTGTMSALGGLGVLVTLGSLYGICILFGLWAYSGQLAIYHVMREVFPRQYHKRMLVACLLLPSVLFWGSALLKETVALGGLGWAILGLRRLLFTGHVGKGLAFLALGCTVITITKPYILFPLVVCGAIWFYWYRSSQSGEDNLAARFGYLILVALALVPLVLWLGELFPQYAVDNVTTETARLQSAYYNLDNGGSTYMIGDTTKTSSDQQISLAPVALVAALFRPFIFEAHNVASMVNALETFVLALLVLAAVYQRGIKSSVLLLSRSPFAMFCLIFVLIFGTAVGLGAPNLGSLSRYRIPMMPLYAAVVLLLLPVRARHSRTVGGPARGPVDRGPMGRPTGPREAAAPRPGRRSQPSSRSFGPRRRPRAPVPPAD